MNDRNKQFAVFNTIEDIIVGFFAFFGRFAMTTWLLGRCPANGVRFAADTLKASKVTPPFTYLVVSSILGTTFYRKVTKTYNTDSKALAKDSLNWLEGLSITTILLDSVAVLLVVGGLAYLLGFLLSLRVSMDQRTEKRQTAVRLLCYGTGFQFVLTLAWGCVWIALIYVWDEISSFFPNLDDIITLWILIGVALVILLSSTRIYWHGISSLLGTHQQLHRISRGVLSAVLSTSILALAFIATYQWQEITRPSIKELELSIATFSLNDREFSATVYITNNFPERVRLMDVTKVIIKFDAPSGKFLGYVYPKVQTVEWETQGTNALVIESGSEGFLTLKGSGIDALELAPMRSGYVQIKMILKFQCVTRDGMDIQYARGIVR